MKILAALVVGVALGVAAETDQSEPTIPEAEPMKENVGERRQDSPEVVLQLKYDGGELNRIYLAQYRAAAWSPRAAVAPRAPACADLCHAGLGGAACGAGCARLAPAGLRAALRRQHDGSEPRARPRAAVCPALCRNRLGQPLCACAYNTTSASAVSWDDVCHAFCSDGYTLPGCACEDEGVGGEEGELEEGEALRALSSAEGWAAWCGVQCQQGLGGAACNCDRTPFQ